MDRIKTFWLGIPIIKRGSSDLHLETRKAVALLAYIGLSSPTPQSREKLATIFWPEYDQQRASSNLRRSLFSINHELGPDLLVSNRENIILNPSFEFWQDVCDFYQHLDAIKSHTHEGNPCKKCIDHLEKAITLNRGTFLEGLNLRDSPDFDNWQNMQREYFHQNVSSSLAQLTYSYTSLENWEKGLQRAQQWVSMDHLNEKAQLALIKLYVQSGQKSTALHQFNEFTKVLKEELDQSPDDVTMTLFNEIITTKTTKTENIPAVAVQESINVSKKQPLIKTKLFIPHLHKGVVPRPHLLKKLEEGSDNLLTLISAPAGYGKTTLLVEWIDSLQKKNSPIPWAVCWLSLDSGDNDPARFLEYLTSALERVDLKLSLETQEIIRTTDNHFPRSPLASLLNDLQNQDQSILLVLDDFQFINNPAIHDGVTFLLDHLPDNVHIVIATRSDPQIPLSRLRARGQLSEIRAEDLRFSSSETDLFLNRVFCLDLSLEQITKLENRTEGWIAGLQLAAVSMQGRSDIPKFIDAFSGSHRFIMDYLVEEAFTRQSSEIQEFLLQTSILERLNDSLCEFVLNIRTDSENISAPFSQEPSSTQNKQNPKLAEIENMGLFVVSQDDERIWYRYHHLFADLLRTRLQSTFPGLVPILHHRASIWFENNGDIEESIDHSLASEDHANSSRLLELHIPIYLENGQMTTVLNWLERFPQEEILKRPKLSVEVAEMYSQAGLIDQIDPFLDQAEQLVSCMQDPQKPIEAASGNTLSAKDITFISSMIPILRGLKAVCSAKPQLAVELTQTALESIPQMESKELAVLFWVQGWAQRSLGNLHVALELLTKGTEYAKISGAALRDIWTDLGNVTRLVGKLPQAIQILENSFQSGNEKDIQNKGNLSRNESFLSFLYYEKNQLDLALMYANRALAHTQWWPSHNIIATANVSLAQILLARNDLHGSLLALQRAEEARKNRIMTPFVHSLVEVTWVQVWLNQNDWDSLDRWEQNQHANLNSNVNSNEKIDEYLELRLIMLVRLWIEKTEKDQKKERYDAALSLLDRLDKSSRASGRGNSLIVILLYKAIILFKMKRVNQAFKELNDCLALAESGEYMRIFLDINEFSQGLFTSYLQRSEILHKKYAMKIAKELSDPQQAKTMSEGLIEPLTLRELEILRLLIEGCSNHEIAERLVVSEGTIKFHVHNILGKMNASSRTQAIAIARELNLI